MNRDSIVDVPGIRVGHYSDALAATGCTVVLCDSPMIGGGLVAGASPGTRETALLDPSCAVQGVDAVLVSGGSAFGLDAASGVVRYLEERGRGFDTRVAKVPIVPGAVIFDLGLGDPSVRPGAEEGYAACLAARNSDVLCGSIGAGTGATVGKLRGPALATKGGLGSASVRLAGGVVVGALAVVNCAGNVVDPETGATVAGVRRISAPGFESGEQALLGQDPYQMPGQNTTIGVVATSASLTKAQTAGLAWLAYQGLARTVRPITPFDGDAIFTLAAADGRTEGDLAQLGAAAGLVISAAILRAVRQATSLHGCPSASEAVPGA